ncbi:Rieske 2Fe-2S domain-containing protein [Pusillimonas noertemannii]|uniref:Phthalate 4,5-dioxygenase oxygenase subunit n=1 Tax=Pusillimonas noertemannii TaxID=305977 RepID=A0A2U1CP33_9BURK|nr:Rieske 2Fe-2S domain-containing protein [Pusillimonas noertemannii]NYT68281.1 Rieske 2Fe-2S domain-containing protein [Pusillimonas noertemannii]PVY62704.1 phthalate 4,5-dioxygenase oxygenase subunit [Pusillimonas noertemannii]
MLTQEENELLTRVGPGTPMGETMRRYWLPVCTSAQLPAPDCAPLRTELLGELFVVFRNTDGQVGVLDEACMHRGVSLALGRVENNGIRCLYHGWKFGIDGSIQEMPNHPNSASFRERMKAPSFPVREEGGLVWTYIGPKEKQPVFQRYAFMRGADENRVVVRVDTDANYLQLYEGGTDSSHVGILHHDHVAISEDTAVETVDLGIMAVDDHAPSLDIVDTEYGYIYAAQRKGPIESDGTETHSIRVTPVIFPTGRIIPAPGSFQYYLFEVPQNDHVTSTYVICHGDEKADRQGVLQILGLLDERFWNEEDCKFRAHWEVNRMNQDRHRMDKSFTGFSGIEQEDAVLAISMGPIVNRAKEHLVAADRAVMHLRARLMESVRRCQAGEDPIGVHVADYSSVVSLIDTTVRKGDRWQKLVMPELDTSES